MDNQENITKYLEDLVRDLNSNCVFQINQNPEITSYEWLISDVSLNIYDCRRLCHIIDRWTDYENRVLCESCKNLLDTRIRQRFNMSLLELNIQFDSLKLEVRKLLEIFNTKI